MNGRHHPFDRLVATEGKLRLGEAALLFAVDRTPDLDVAAYLARLDEIRMRVWRKHGITADQQIETLREVLVGELGLTGNVDDYYDPANSYLDSVLDRGLGIPISLSAVWLDVTASLGWPFFGVGLPGHFLVGRADGFGRQLIDPFGGGRLLDLPAAGRLAAGAIGRPVEIRPVDLAPVSNRAILTRMLANLRAIYLEREDWTAALAVLRRLRAIDPSPARSREVEAVARRVHDRN